MRSGHVLSVKMYRMTCLGVRAIQAWEGLHWYCHDCVPLAKEAVTRSFVGPKGTMANVPTGQPQATATATAI